MATRRLSSALPAARPGLLACALAPGLVLAPLPAAAQFMALTPSPRSDAVPPEPRKPVPPTTRAAEHAFNGQLPNQRTGTGRQRVVRDICIGCDR